MSVPPPAPGVEVVLAIGSNIGDRAATLRDAVRRLVAGGVMIDAVSSLYETPPWGYADQPRFLNGAVRGRTTLSARELLTLVKRVELDLGRQPTFRNGPRPVDIDIALYGDRVIDEPELHVPHPGLPERAFVLVPLAEVAGTWVHPALGKTIGELRAALGPADEIEHHLAPARWAYITPEMERSREAAEIVIDAVTHPRYLARVLALHSASELHAELCNLGVTDDAATKFILGAKNAIIRLDGISNRDARVIGNLFHVSEGATYVTGGQNHATLLLTNLPTWFGPRRWALEANENVSPDDRERVQQAGEAACLAVQRQANPPATVAIGKHRFDWANRVVVMGILNATPDSFSDAGKYFKFDDALRRAYEMAEQGADMIEVGGQSARPGTVISVDEELARIVPLLERLRDEIGLPLAVDTFRVGVARGAAAAGAIYINDIGGGGDEGDGMARLAAETGVLLGIMHLRGRPKEKQWETDYASVMDEVTGFLHERIGRAVAVGVVREKIVIDPGLGFGKEAPHDLEVMHRFSELRSFGLPILLATSRKNYLSDTVGGTVQDLLPETAAAVTYGIAQGANIIRVHDIAFMARIARLMPHILRHTAT